MGLEIDYGYDFERFWKSYPRKVSKGAAFKAFQKLKLDSGDVDQLVLHLERRKKDDARWLEDDGKFIPHPGTFLNQHRWLDDYQRVKAVIGQRNVNGHTPTDEENLRLFWSREHAKGREVPEKYRCYVETH